MFGLKRKITIAFFILVAFAISNASGLGTTLPAKYQSVMAAAQKATSNSKDKNITTINTKTIKSTEKTPGNRPKMPTMPINPAELQESSPSTGSTSSTVLERPWRLKKDEVKREQLKSEWEQHRDNKLKNKIGGVLKDLEKRRQKIEGKAKANSVKPPAPKIK